MEPIIDTFRNFQLPASQIVPMRSNDRQVKHTFNLWVNDISRMAELTDELKLSWTAREFFQVAESSSVDIAAKFQILKGQVNNYLAALADEISCILFQIGFGLKQVLKNFGENDPAEMERILKMMVDHVGSDDFSKYSLALDTFKAFLKHSK